MKKHSMIVVIIVALLFAVGMVAWAKSMQSNSGNADATGDSEILSTRGLHWHPELEIYVKGVKQDIPNGLGLTGVHKPVHTHDDIPIVHLEFPARVTTDDTKLGKFFEVWGKNPSDFGQTVTMTVNAEPNADLMDYQMKDGDKIELRYE